MTKEENIATLNEHLEHWKRLLSEKICDQSEGVTTIDALQNAIKALEQEPCDDAEWVDDKCSACGKGIEDLIDSREWYENEKPNFCPFCGKKFKESEVQICRLGY